MSESAPLSFRLRVSARARQARLRFHPQRGLEVVIPPGYDPARVAVLLARHRHWITEQHARHATALAEAVRPPAALELRAVDERWALHWEAGGRPALRVPADGRLLLRGVNADHVAARVLLRRWLMRRAQAILAPWLERLAQETGLSYHAFAIRQQRSRWGSCSAQGNISLNSKLLFLPPELVQHVLLHELCHTVELNHSPRFWTLLARFDADWREARERLRAAWRYVPGWFEE
ncbi:MAG TPA: SprT family zinc-dependent metalloprotease [Candidatus Competibacteraceae bacterium]|nr:SprT family zinc-dependent metalloprotease [Candidatus Competibacteraceae bacterium]